MRSASARLAAPTAAWNLEDERSAQSVSIATENTSVARSLPAAGGSPARGTITTPRRGFPNPRESPHFWAWSVPQT